MDDSELKRHVETELHREVRLRGRPISVAVEEGRVVLKGEVESLAEKRLATNLVRQLREVGELRDALRLPIVHQLTDRQIQDHIYDALLEDRAIDHRTVDVAVDDHVVTLRGTVDSLEAKRLTGLLAWWVPGVADVLNEMRVVPHQEGTQGDLVDSVRQALSKDILVNADTIGVSVLGNVVTLQGYVGSAEEKLAAEHDAYYIWGVESVINRLEVMPR